MTLLSVVMETNWKLIGCVPDRLVVTATTRQWRVEEGERERAVQVGGYV